MSRDDQRHAWFVAGTTTRFGSRVNKLANLRPASGAGLTTLQRTVSEGNRHTITSDVIQMSVDSFSFRSLALYLFLHGSISKCVTELPRNIAVSLALALSADSVDSDLSNSPLLPPPPLPFHRLIEDGNLLTRLSVSNRNGNVYLNNMSRFSQLRRDLRRWGYRDCCCSRSLSKTRESTILNWSVLSASRNASVQFNLLCFHLKSVKLNIKVHRTAVLYIQMFALLPLPCTVGIIHAQGTEMCFGYNVASHLQVVIAKV
jgi:hypothetical protein